MWFSPSPRQKWKGHGNRKISGQGSVFSLQKTQLLDEVEIEYWVVLIFLRRFFCSRFFSFSLSWFLLDHLLRPFSWSPSRPFLSSCFFLLCCFGGSLVFAASRPSSGPFRGRLTDWFLLQFPWSPPSPLRGLFRGCRRLLARSGRLPGSFTSCAHRCRPQHQQN